MPLRPWKKFLGITILGVITLVVVGITFTIGWRPFIGAKHRALTGRKFEATPQRLARGKYLVEESWVALVVIRTQIGQSPARRRSRGRKDRDTSGLIRACPG